MNPTSRTYISIRFGYCEYGDQIAWFRKVKNNFVWWRSAVIIQLLSKPMIYQKEEKNDMRPRNLNSNHSIIRLDQLLNKNNNFKGNENYIAESYKRILAVKDSDKINHRLLELFDEELSTSMEVCIVRFIFY